jgi:hypothetical protein
LGVGEEGVMLGAMVGAVDKGMKDNRHFGAPVQL